MLLPSTSSSLEPAKFEAAVPFVFCEDVVFLPRLVGACDGTAIAALVPLPVLDCSSADVTFLVGGMVLGEVCGSSRDRGAEAHVRRTKID